MTLYLDQLRDFQVAFVVKKAWPKSVNTAVALTLETTKCVHIQ